jgi:phage terminase large subunit-like protein
LSKTDQEIIKEIKELEEKIRLQEGLPFLHGWPWYTWAWEYFHSTNKINFLVAANQVSKSSTNIRKCIDWATNKEKWPLLWRRTPKQFWYMYPSSKVLEAEWTTKWSQFLPGGEYKDSQIYGWKEEKSHGGISAVHFKSGVHLYFKTYAQKASDLQAGSVDALFLDEECPVELWDELANRTNATDGYIHMVFTATLGQEMWRKTMEPREDEQELFPTAAKWCVSLYDSMKYMDGTRSQWSEKRIQEIKNKCKSHAEFLKRVMGRFVVSGGRKYESFDATKHMKAPFEIPYDWLIYEGVDIGSGGEEGHPSAICFVAVRPDYKKGVAFRGWRGDGIVTTAGDTFQKHLELKKTINRPIVLQAYDYASKDFYTIAQRAGESFVQAEKSHEIGEGIINTLFKNDMLVVFDDEEMSKLGGELATLQEKTSKKKAKDDFIDAFRYAVAQIPWQFEVLLSGDMSEPPVQEELTDAQREIHDRRGFVSSEPIDEQGFNAEFEEWNEAYGSS